MSKQVLDTVDKDHIMRLRMGYEKMIAMALSRGALEDREHKKSRQSPAVKLTQKRLYALPSLRENLVEDEARLNSLREEGISMRGVSAARFQRSGTRLSADEICEGLIADLRASIAQTEHEIKQIEFALNSIRQDRYYEAISGKYFEELSDERIAENISCDVSTVRRNRARLLQKLAVKLYGVKAIC